MKILVLTGPCYPRFGNNANLICKVIKQLLPNNEVRLLSTAFGVTNLPKDVQGLSVSWVTDNSISLKDRAVAKIVDSNGYSDYVTAIKIAKMAEKLRRDFNFDVIVSTIEPFPCAYASVLLNGAKRILYIMDPPAPLADNKGTGFRLKQIKRILDSQDSIITTPFINQAFKDAGYDIFEKVKESGFPMICESITENNDVFEMDRKKINLLFCGWLYSDIRSPKYFLDIVSRLDERFCIYFMGKECDRLDERFNIKTKAQIVTMDNQPYSVALSAMNQADILINIGNSIPVHMPSKTLEYINTGKPFVNFYKMHGCPTLHYTKKYPLCLNIFEGNKNINADADRFVDFCLNSINKQVDREYIQDNYKDCTPGYIAYLIEKELEEN